MTTPDFKGQFMPTMIPAASGTYIVELGESGAILRTPIIAWAPDADNPYKAPHPITVNGLARLVGGRAVQSPCGMVHSPYHALCFNDVEEWKVIAAKEPRSAEPTERPVASAKTTKPAASKEGPQLAIEWAKSAFKNNSFYRYDDGVLDFIFQIDGETLPPKQTGAVTKIKRDEFMALKKTVDVAEADALREGRAPGMDEIGDFEDDLFVGSEPEDDDDLI